MSIHAILLMGGISSRFKSDLPKQFQYLAGKPVYQHSLDTFLSFPEIDTIVIVAHPRFTSMIQAVNTDPRLCFAPAGATRQLSSKSGLEALSQGTGSVIIHDAARPLLPKRVINAHIEALKNYSAVNTCIPSADTIIVTHDATLIDSVPNRCSLMRGQTPQSFHLPLIIKAHELTKQQEATDDCQLIMETTDIKPYIVLGDERNMKITHDLDLTLAEHLLREPETLPTTTMPTRLEGKVFAVTGGMGGIGSAIIKALKTQGATALCLSRSSPDYPCNLNEFEATKATFDTIFETYGPIDGLIHTVGDLKIAPFASHTADEIRHMIDTNFTSNLYAAACVKLKQGGHIINFASSAFYRGRKDYALYSSSKAAIVNFTQALALEKPEYHINVAVPYRTNTKMRTKNFPNEDPSLLLSPEEVAEQTLNILQSRLKGAVVAIRKPL